MKVIIIGSADICKKVLEITKLLEEKPLVIIEDQPSSCIEAGKAISEIGTSFAELADNFGVNREELEEAILKIRPVERLINPADIIQLSKIDQPKKKPFYQHRSKFHN